MQMPAAPATTRAEISSVPCRNTVSSESMNSPCWAKNISKLPNITPLLKSMAPVKMLVNTPITNSKNDT